MDIKTLLDVAASLITVGGFLFALFRWLDTRSHSGPAPVAPSPPTSQPTSTPTLPTSVPPPSQQVTPPTPALPSSSSRRDPLCVLEVSTVWPEWVWLIFLISIASSLLFGIPTLLISGLPTLFQVLAAICMSITLMTLTIGGVADVVALAVAGKSILVIGGAIFTALSAIGGLVMTTLLLNLIGAGGLTNLLPPPYLQFLHLLIGIFQLGSDSFTGRFFAWFLVGIFDFFLVGWRGMLSEWLLAMTS